MNKVPFNRRTISKKDLISVLEHLIEENTSSGEIVKQFEKELGKLQGIGDRVILTNSGASSLFLILQHIGIQRNDEIILSPLSEPWVAEVICFFSATPVWIDISLESLQMNHEHLSQKISANTRAVIINHHFGLPYFTSSGMDTNSESFFFFQKDFPQISVIEDITSGLLTRYHNKYLGSFGDYAFTCFENERLITTEGGGAIFTKNRKEATKIRQMRSYRENFNKEEEKKEDMAFSQIFPKRLDLCLSDMQAALGLSELSLVEKMISRCEQIKEFYQDSLSKSRHSFIVTGEETLSNHFGFPVILQGDVNMALKIFGKEKIEIKDMVQDTCYQNLPYLDELKNLNQLKHKVILIPIYPTLRKEEIEKISLLVNSIR